MTFWRRFALRSKGYVSFIVVSSHANRVRELRLSRSWYRFWVIVVPLAVTLAIIVAATRSYSPSNSLERRPLEVKLEESNRKTQELAVELAQMKEVAENIRHLAGVREFEASASPPKADYTTDIEDSVTAEESILATSETRLPFILRDRMALVDEKDIEARQKTLFRSTPFTWPVRGWVTREFQSINDPIIRQHSGMDIAAQQGTPVISAGDGIVTYADWDQDLGWLVVIEHGYGFTSRYGHNASLRVAKGNRIQRGQIIALVGSTGRSSAPHLHYEIWKDRIPVNPRSYLPDAIQWDDLQGVGGLSGQAAGRPAG